MTLADRPEFRWGQRTVGLVVMLSSLSLVSGTVSRGISGVLSPFIQDAYSLSYAQVGMIGGVFSIAGLLLSIPLGGAVDVLGVRRSLIGSQVLMVAGLVLTATASAFGPFLAGLFLIGMGRTLLQPGSNSMVVNGFPHRLLATVMGLKQMGVSAGSSLSALVLPYVALQAGWRSSLGFLAGISALLAAALLLVPGQTSDVRSGGRRFSVGALAELLKNRSIRRFGFVCVLGVGTQMAIETHTMLFLIRRIDLSPVQGGMIIFMTGLAATVGRVLWGVAADRLWPNNRRIPLFIAFGTAAACALGLAGADRSWPLAAVGGVIALQGLSLLGWNTLQMTIASELGGRESAGMTTGFALTCGAVGGLSGAPLFGWAVDASGGYLLPWAGAAAALIAACIVMTGVRSEH